MWHGDILDEALMEGLVAFLGGYPICRRSIGAFRRRALSRSMGSLGCLHGGLCFT